MNALLDPTGKYCTQECGTRAFVRNSIECRYRTMGIIGEPFSGREQVAAEVVRCLREIFPDVKRVECLDNTTIPQLAEPFIAYIRDMETLDVPEPLPIPGTCRCVVYTSSGCISGSPFITVGDVTSDVALDTLLRMRALRTAIPVGACTSGDVPVNRMAIEHLAQMMRDQSLYDKHPEQTIVSWRGYMSTFDLSQETGYLESFLKRLDEKALQEKKAEDGESPSGEKTEDIDTFQKNKGTFLKACVQLYGCSEFTPIGIFTDDVRPCIDAMAEALLVHSDGDAVRVSDYTGEVLRTVCKKKYGDTEWDKATLASLASEKPADIVLIPARKLYGMLIVSTDLVTGKDASDEDCRNYSKTVGLVRSHDLLDDYSLETERLLNHVLGRIRGVKPESGGSTDYNELGSRGLLEPLSYFLYKSVNSLLYGPTKTDTIQLRDRMRDMSDLIAWMKDAKVPPKGMSKNELDTIQHNLRVMRAVCQNKLRIQCLQDDPSRGLKNLRYTVYSDEPRELVYSSDDSLGLSLAEVLDCASSYMEVLVERMEFDEAAKLLMECRLRIEERGNRDDAEDCVSDAIDICRIRLSNLESRLRRKMLRAHVGNYTEAENEILSRPGRMSKITLSGLNGRVQNATILRLGQELDIESAKTMVSKNEVFLAETLVSRILDNPSDAYIRMVALDCQGAMRSQVGDWESAEASFRDALEMYDSYIQVRRAMVCRGRLAIALSRNGDYSEVKTTNEILGNFIRDHKEEFGYTSGLLMDLIGKVYR